jgi:hypothetical protein
MDELASLEQKKINRLECDTHKNVRENRVKTVQANNEKTKRKNVFKVKRCGSSLLTSNRKI